MTSFLLHHNPSNFSIPLTSNILLVHPFFLKTTPPKEALVIHTSTSVSIFTPHDKVHHPINHTALDAIHIYSTMDSFSLITKTAQVSFVVTKKEMLSTLTKTKGIWYPTPTNSIQFPSPVISACGTQHVFILHENGNLTLLRPRMMVFDLHLPKGNIKGYGNVVVVYSERTTFFRFNEKKILENKQIGKVNSVAVGKQYIYCGNQNVISVYSTKTFNKISEFDIRDSGVMGDFIPLSIDLTRNGSLVVNYENLGIALFNGNWNCTAKLWKDRKLNKGVVEIEKGVLWAIENNELTRWELKESVNCDDLMTLNVVIGQGLGVIENDGIKWYKVPNRILRVLQKGTERITVYKTDNDLLLIALSQTSLYLTVLDNTSTNETINILSLETQSKRAAITWTFSNDRIIIIQQLCSMDFIINITVLSFPDIQRLYVNTHTIPLLGVASNPFTGMSPPPKFLSLSSSSPDPSSSPTFIPTPVACSDLPTGTSYLLIQVEGDYIFLMIARQSPRLLVFKKIDAPPIFEINPLFELPITNNEINVITSDRHPTSFVLHYTYNCKIIEPQQLVTKWDGGLLTTTLYKSDNFTEIEECQVISNRVQSFLSIGKFIITYPPLTLHGSHTLSLPAPPSQSVVVFNTSTISKYLNSGFELTNEVLYVNGSTVSVVPCGPHLIIARCLDGEQINFTDETLRDIIIHSLTLTSNNEITEEQLKLLHQQFQKNSMYSIIIVRVARIIDSSLWNLLFTVTHDPVKLFNDVKNSGFFNEAASFIRVMDVIVGREKAIFAASELLDEVDSILVHDIIRTIYHEQSLENPTPKEEEISNTIHQYIVKRLTNDLTEGNIINIYQMLNDSHPFILLCLKDITNKTMDFEKCHESVTMFVQKQTKEECLDLGMILLDNQFYQHVIMLGIHTQIKQLLLFDGSQSIFEELFAKYESFNIDTFNVMKIIKKAVFSS
ncbi:RIC1 C-terminal alpha solenoid region domain-containing protein [Entamoeba marina]